MEVYHWVLYGMDLLVILSVIAGSTRIIIFMMKLNRSERRENIAANHKVITELKDAILKANNQTTIFQSSVKDAQVGSNTTIDKINTKGGDAVMGDQNG